MAIFSACWAFDILTLFFGVLTTFYFISSRKYSYWDRKGIKTLPGFSYLCGHFNGIFFKGVALGDWFTKLYNSTKEPFIGIYGIFRPILFVRDPQLIQTILIKDFTHFTDRGIFYNEDLDPLSAHLFVLPGQKWRNLRGKLSPAFTSGKLKAMFSTLVGCGSTLQNYLKNLAENDELLDVREIAASHATNVIASVAFGIEVDTINDPQNDFRVSGRKIFEPSTGNILRMLISFIAPKLMSLLRLRITDQSVENFIISVVKQNLEYREQNNVSRKDFFQLLIQLRNNGTVELDDQWQTVIKADENQKTLTLNEMSAHTFLFFFAGFETSSTTLSFCLYELAKNQKIQKQVHDEIDRVLEKHDGQITYESISDMKYLERCIDGEFIQIDCVTFLQIW